MTIFPTSLYSAIWLQANNRFTWGRKIGSYTFWISKQTGDSWCCSFHAKISHRSSLMFYSPLSNSFLLMAVTLTWVDSIQVSFFVRLLCCHIWKLNPKHDCPQDSLRKGDSSSPSGLVTAKIHMTSHSAEDKAHWFLPNRRRGGGGAVGAERAKEGENWWICCSGVYISVCVKKSSMYTHVRQLGGSICTCAVWVM